MLLLRVSPAAKHAKERKRFWGDTPQTPGKGLRPLQPRFFIEGDDVLLSIRDGTANVIQKGRHWAEISSIDTRRVFLYPL